MSSECCNNSSDSWGPSSCGYPALDLFQGPFTNWFKEALTHAATVCDECERERVTPDDLWLGLLRCRESFALKVLGRCGVSLAEFQTAIEAAIPRLEYREFRLSNRWSSDALFIMATAMKLSEEQEGLKDYVGSEHIVWALLKGESAGTTWAREHGVDADTYCRECIVLIREIAEETEAKQKALFARFRGGDKAARQELFKSSLEFATNCARSMAEEESCPVDSYLPKANELATTAVDTFTGETEKEWDDHVWTVMEEGFRRLYDDSRDEG